MVVLRASSVSYSHSTGDLIDEIHKKWFGNHGLLEEHHGYIQCLFPIREQGMNFHAQELQLHEAQVRYEFLLQCWCFFTTNCCLMKDDTLVTSEIFRVYDRSIKKTCTIRNGRSNLVTDSQEKEEYLFFAGISIVC